MEKVLGQLPRIRKPKAELHELVAGEVRICKATNSWNPGKGYINSGSSAGVG
jgi:hypothetical protein